MKFLRKWVDRIVGGDKDLEMADRRLFLQGLAVASSGLVIPRAIVSAPAPEIIWITAGMTLWVGAAGWVDPKGIYRNELADPVHPTFDSVSEALRFANAKGLEEPVIALTPGYSEIVTDDFGAWPKMPKGTRIVGMGPGDARPEYRSRR